MESVCSFLCLPKETNQRKGTQALVPPKAGFPVLLDAAGALQTRCAQTEQIPFPAASPVLGCVPMGFSFPPFVLPRLADVAEKTREVSEATQWRRLRLFEGEARVFPRPALGEKQGKPAGPGLAGVPFSCFFFWARKRRKRERQKDHSCISRKFRMKKGQSKHGSKEILRNPGWAGARHLR